MKTDRDPWIADLSHTLILTSAVLMKLQFLEAFTPNDVWFDLLDGVVLSYDAAAGVVSGWTLGISSWKLPYSRPVTPKGILWLSRVISFVKTKGFVRVVRLRERSLEIFLDVANRVR